MTAILPRPRLVQVTNRHTAVMPLPELARRAIEGGVDLVQIREKDLTECELESLCRDIVDAVGDTSRIMVNGSPEVARRLGIGLHLPEEMADSFSFASGEFSRISRAIHSEPSDPNLDRYDFVIVGHIFETGGKAGRPPLGLDRLRALIGNLPIDAIAIGGMQPDRIASVLEAGAKGIAVLSAINESKEPEKTAALFIHAMENTMLEPSPELIPIQLNGKPVSVAAGTTVTGYLAGRGFHERMVVVELNGSILSKKLFAETTLTAGDKVEIVHFVGGG